MLASLGNERANRVWEAALAKGDVSKKPGPTAAWSVGPPMQMHVLPQLTCALPHVPLPARPPTQPPNPTPQP